MICALFSHPLEISVRLEIRSLLQISDTLIQSDSVVIVNEVDLEI